jgi:putative endonuclease
MPYVYILECKDKSLYVGSTWRPLEARVNEHNLGLGSAYTRRQGRRPVRLVWFEEHGGIAGAFGREKQIQGWGRAKRLALIEGRLSDLPSLSRSTNNRPEPA